MSAGWIALSPVLALSVNFVVQITALKVLRGSVLPSVVIGAAGGEGCFLALNILNISLTDPWFYFFLCQTAYLCAAFCYFAFVNLNATSLRIRILEELRSAGGHAPMEVITGNYGSKEVVRARLDRMVRSGLLLERNGFYHIGKQYPLIVARLMDALRSFLLRN